MIDLFNLNNEKSIRAIKFASWKTGLKIFRDGPCPHANLIGAVDLDRADASAIFNDFIYCRGKYHLSGFIYLLWHSQLCVQKKEAKFHNSTGLNV